MRQTLLAIIALLMATTPVFGEGWRRYYFPSEPGGAARWTAPRSASSDDFYRPPTTLFGPYWYGGTYSYWNYLRATDPRWNPDPWPYRWDRRGDVYGNERDRNYYYAPGYREPRWRADPRRPSVPESTGRRWYEHEQPRGTSPRWFDRSGRDEGSRRCYDRVPNDRPDRPRPPAR
jgi:hypothetical protein